MASIPRWSMLLVVALVGALLQACAAGSGSHRVRPGVFVTQSLADDLHADAVEIEPAAGTIPMSVSATIRWDGFSVQNIEYRIEFSPSSTGNWPWKPAVLRPGEETLLAESAYDTQATDWRMEIRPRR